MLESFRSKGGAEDPDPNEDETPNGVGEEEKEKDDEKRGQKRSATKARLSKEEVMARIRKLQGDGDHPVGEPADEEEEESNDGKGGKSSGGA